MNNLAMAEFNELHHKDFGCAAEFSIPEKMGQDHCPVV
jgi:hypothetical protein